jgi:hypothetical protein
LPRYLIRLSFRIVSTLLDGHFTRRLNESVKKTSKSRIKSKSRINKSAKLTAESILKSLDDAYEEGNFPAFVNFEWRFGAARMHGFSDLSDWAIVFEEFTYGFNGDIDDFAVLLQSFGSHLPRRNLKKIFLHPIEKGPCGFLCFFKEGESRSYHSQRLHPKASDFKIRGKTYPIKRQPNEYKKLGIQLEHSPEILKVEFQRWLADNYRDSFFATKEELGIELPKVLQLENWHHPSARGDLPSKSQTFQLIAKALETGDSSLYTMKDGNVHWSQRP